MMSSMASRGSDSAAAMRLDPDRPAAIVHRDGREIAPVHRIEPGRIDLERAQRVIGDGAVDRSRHPRRTRNRAPAAAAARRCAACRGRGARSRWRRQRVMPILSTRAPRVTIFSSSSTV